MDPSRRIKELTEKGIAKKALDSYWPVFYDRFSQPSVVDFEELCSNFSTKPNTVKKYLKTYLQFYPEHIGKVTGIIPNAETIVTLAEQQLGALTAGETVWAVNEQCKKIVDGIVGPKHDEFLRKELERVNALNGETVTMTFSEMSELLRDTYSEYLTSEGNSLVSVAGEVNEEILLRGLENAGLNRDIDFLKTGTEGDGDIKVSGPSSHLIAEVKSYRARERFLRGLSDIKNREKVGVGFFIDPAEFNPKRTEMISEKNPWAVYLPDKTLDALSEKSKEMLTTQQNKIYRPLSSFFLDMIEFTRTGQLPRTS